MPRTNVHYGWVPDLPDQRDHMFAGPSAVMATLPTQIDLRPKCPPVVDQGPLGSCTANAIANAHRFDQLRQAPKKSFMPSRLFIYYNERVMEGTVASDSGAMIRDGIKSVAQLGVCNETGWPYNIAKFKTKPSAALYKKALAHQALTYQRLMQTSVQMKSCLATGFPFVFGFTVYESFETQAVAKTGVVPMPGSAEKTLGGHAVLAVGYDDASQRFIVMNSWSDKWGMKGYFTIPYAYLVEPGLASDFWTVSTVEV